MSSNLYLVSSGKVVNVGDWINSRYWRLVKIVKLYPQDDRVSIAFASGHVKKIKACAIQCEFRMPHVTRRITTTLEVSGPEDEDIEVRLHEALMSSGFKVVKVMLQNPTINL